MKFLQSITSKFSTSVLGNLSAEEERALQAARRAVRYGWAARKQFGAFKPKKSPFETAGLSEARIIDLNSSDRERQRIALRHAGLQAYLRIEERRWAGLRSMFYFREKLETLENLTFSEAFSAIEEDWKQFGKNDLIEDTDEGASLRAATFSGVDDDSARFGAALVCRAFLVALQSALREYDPSDLNDDRFRERLMDLLVRLRSQNSDKNLEQNLNRLEASAHCTKPRQIEHYLDILQRPNWKEAFFIAQGEFKSRSATIHVERERVATAKAVQVAEQERQLLEEQLTFSIVEEVLDISPRNWPKLESEDDLRKLLANMRAAFAQVRRVRCAGRKLEEDYRDVRSIVSMSAKQLACVKIEVWKSKAGYRAGVDNPSYLTNRMLGLLNCDIPKKSGPEVAVLFPIATAGGDVDVEREWSDNLDSLHKWIDDDGFKGDLARWFVEDRDKDNGWATSR
ncbi:hypothetical protein [Rhodopseudomonas sp. RCAM05734]|uniref:hypothetical protein n=1 Tax=Rhodopseudomonas sp. RCAM05734 TaxID=3457549 RepID=UPI004044A635